MSLPYPTYSQSGGISVPGYNNSNYSSEKVSNYVKSLMANGSNVSGLNSIIHGSTLAATAYCGCVYSPTQNRIYLVPNGQASNATWHYIDCSNSGALVPYTHGMTGLLASAYIGGAYSPTQNRIYFTPNGQASDTTWHFVDCNTGNIVPYVHGMTGVVSQAYIGSVYSPTQNRIYFIPRVQSLSSNLNWHYVDCNINTVATPPAVSTNLIVPYLNPGTAVATAYYGGAYSPTENRIYFAPASQGLPWNGSAQPSTQFWHYIDCNVTGSTVTIGTYLNPNNAVSVAYVGAAYSPTQNRVYFLPFNQGPQPNWHFIDCNTGAVVSYITGATVPANGYRGGVYSPVDNRIYLIASAQASILTWHYIDCNTGAVVLYTQGLSGVGSTIGGGVYSPTENRIYITPYNSTTLLYFWDFQSNAPTSKVFMAGAAYNHM